MVNYSTASDNAPLDATFGALADPTRRAILARLVRGEATVTELARPSTSRSRPSPSTCASSNPRAYSGVKSTAASTAAASLHDR